MNTANIQLTQMDIIRRVLNVSDMNLHNKIKAFIISNNENSTTYANQNYITEKLQKDIDEARKEYKRGESLHFESAADAQKWMNAL